MENDKPKRGRGRPRKEVSSLPASTDVPEPKKRGRPPKVQDADTSKKPKWNLAIKDHTPELDDAFDITLDSKTSPSYRDQFLIERLASAMLTETEVCAIIKVPRHEFDDNLTFRASFARGQEMGKASLRRLQWKSAQSNPTMQIFLGKQYLGQSDKVEGVQGEEQSAAFARFVDKLKNIVDVTPKGATDGSVDSAGKGDGTLLLADVGQGKPTDPDKGTVVEFGNDSEADSGLASEAKKRGEDFLRELANVVTPGGTGVRENQDGSGVGQIVSGG
jgi:hypothetical protein